MTFRRSSTRSDCPSAETKKILWLFDSFEGLPKPTDKDQLMDIPSGDATVRGRFFPARGEIPLATLLIVPGWGGNTVDASGMGAALSTRGVNTLLINFRGVQQSAGRFSYANALDDLGATSDVSSFHHIKRPLLFFIGCMVLWFAVLIWLNTSSYQETYSFSSDSAVEGGGPGSAYPPDWDSSTVPLSAAQMDSVLVMSDIAYYRPATTKIPG